MKEIHFGLCCSAHDPAIAIVSDDGELLFAEAAERNLQYKRGLNMVADPVPFISRLMQEYIAPDARLNIARTWSKGHHRNIRLAMSGMRLLHPMLRRVPSLRLLTDRYDYMLKLQSHSFAFSGQNLLREWKEKYGTQDRRIPQPKEKYFNHHLCHAAAAAYASPFENALVAIIDGYGELTSTAFYRFDKEGLHPITSIKKSRNSLGFFYSFLCAACGFDPDLGEEWKVMGLAPYGRLLPDLYDRLSSLIPVKNGRFATPGRFFDIALYDRLMHRAISEGRLAYEVQDIACTGQRLFEDKMMECLTSLHKLESSNNLVLAGGCALNSSFNGKIAGRYEGGITMQELEPAVAALVQG